MRKIRKERKEPTLLTVPAQEDPLGVSVFQDYILVTRIPLTHLMAPAPHGSINGKDLPNVCTSDCCCIAMDKKRSRLNPMRDQSR